MRRTRGYDAASLQHHANTFRTAVCEAAGGVLSVNFQQKLQGRQAVALLLWVASLCVDNAMTARRFCFASNRDHLFTLQFGAVTCR